MGPTPLTTGTLSATDPAADGSGSPHVVPVSQKVITAAIVAGPAVALGLAVWWLWGGVIDATDVVIAPVTPPFQINSRQRALDKRGVKIPWLDPF